MPDGIEVKVEDHRLVEKLERLRTREMRKAERRAVTKTTREARKLMQGFAAAHALTIPTRGFKMVVKQNRATGRVEGRAKPGWPYWLLSRGTNERRTKSGASRGFIVPFRFVQEAADIVDLKFRGFLDAEIARAVRDAGFR